MSSSLSQTMTTATGFQELYNLAAAGSFIVIPAFEMNTLDGLEDLGLDAALQRSRQRALRCSQGSKADLLAAAQEGGVIGPFGFWKKYTKSHGPTDYSRWGPLLVGLLFHLGNAPNKIPESACTWTPSCCIK